MPADDDSRIEDSPYPRDHAQPTFELHRVDSRFLEEPAGVADRILVARLVAQERHVTEDERGRRRSPHRLTVHDTLIHRHRDRPLVAVDAHPERVADEEHLQPRFLGKLGRRIVVRRQPRDLLSPFLHRQQVEDRHLLARVHHAKHLLCLLSCLTCNILTASRSGEQIDSDFSQYQHQAAEGKAHDVEVVTIYPGDERRCLSLNRVPACLVHVFVRVEVVVYLPLGQIPKPYPCLLTPNVHALIISAKDTQAGEHIVSSSTQQCHHLPSLLARVGLAEDTPIDDDDRVRTDDHPLMIYRHGARLRLSQGKYLFLRCAVAMLAYLACYDYEIGGDP